jgi:hypothetical protein
MGHQQKEGSPVGLHSGNRLRRGLITAVAVAALVGTAGAALAVSGNGATPAATAPAFLTGCITSGHTLVDVHSNTSHFTCPKGSARVKWNNTGPKGATGAQGPQGATGAQGPAGPAGPAGTVTPKGFGVAQVLVDRGSGPSVWESLSAPVTRRAGRSDSPARRTPGVPCR